MEVGAVGFKKRKKRFFIEKVEKNKEILKPILKTMKEIYPNPDLKNQFIERLR